MMELRKWLYKLFSYNVSEDRSELRQKARRLNVGDEVRVEETGVVGKIVRISELFVPPLVEIEPCDNDADNLQLHIDEIERTSKLEEAMRTSIEDMDVLEKLKYRTKKKVSKLKEKLSNIN